GRACALAAGLESGLACADLTARASALVDGPRHLAPRGGLAPHLAARLLDAPGQRLRTTLDADLQAFVSAVLARRLSGLADRNLRDGAVVVADNATGEILAYVGSGGPASRSPRVDGAAAHRQAGSTLKPFLYGLAVEKTYLTAASLLDDAPINLETVTGLYIPQNYDRDFKGLVSLRTALGNSLNIPAVRTLVLTGVEPFRLSLNAFGYDSIRRDGEYYGYALALGSAEVSLLEQVNAYRALARGGMWSPLRLRADDAEGPERRIMAPGAAHIVADILSDRGARGLTFGLANVLSTPYWSAAKTGTSKAMRDNWCIGFSDRYTVGVWVGNFEGDSMHGVSGITGAGPIWRDVMDRLHEDRPSRPPAPPPGLLRQTVAFDPAVEPARAEWFLSGTEIETVALAPAAQAVPQILSPANGMIIALDPDIPPERQRVAILTRGAEASVLVLDGLPLNTAGSARWWVPQPGYHTLSMRDSAGREVDSVRFTVRDHR
ncbi:MAG: penicillin-binding protein 1C, partial [Rhodospirillaceae bacterium]|nr:penicillin-binding protein 1C [Rhodospirillaceae bacterium]